MHQIYLRLYELFNSPEKTVHSLRKIPKHVGIVVDTINPGSLVKEIDNTIKFLDTIPQIEHITLFFTKPQPTLTFKSSKLHILDESNVNSMFEKDITSEKLNTLKDPFPAPLDAVVFYTPFPNLCNFFPWRLDLASLCFAGKAENISPVSFLDALHVYEQSEQRYGK